MLIISRKKDERIIVADDIEITILEVSRSRVRFGIKAPKTVAIQTRLKQTLPPVITTSPIQEPVTREESSPTEKPSKVVVEFARRG